MSAKEEMDARAAAMAAANAQAEAALVPTLLTPKP